MNESINQSINRLMISVLEILFYSWKCLHSFRKLLHEKICCFGRNLRVHWPIRAHFFFTCRFSSRLLHRSNRRQSRVDRQLWQRPQFWDAAVEIRKCGWKSCAAFACEFGLQSPRPKTCCCLVFLAITLSCLPLLPAAVFRSLFLFPDSPMHPWLSSIHPVSV